MDLSPSVALWQISHGHTHYRCVIEQLGEECFELRLTRGSKVILAQPAEDPAPLLALADVLRVEIEQPKRHHTRHAIALH